MTGAALYKPGICASVLPAWVCFSSKGADDAVDGAMFSRIMSLFHCGVAAFAQVMKWDVWKSFL